MALSPDTYKWESEFALRNRAIGEALGKARALAEAIASCEADAFRRAVLKALDARDIEVSQSVRERLADCTAPSTLDVLLSRAYDIDTAEQLFR